MITFFEKEKVLEKAISNMEFLEPLVKRLQPLNKWYYGDERKSIVEYSYSRDKHEESYFDCVTHITGRYHTNRSFKEAIELADTSDKVGLTLDEVERLFNDDYSDCEDWVKKVEDTANEEKEKLKLVKYQPKEGYVIIHESTKPSFWKNIRSYITNQDS